MFWDSSAVVALLVAEAASGRVRTLAAEAGAIVVWWGTLVECESALARLRVEGIVAMPPVTAALSQLARLASQWHEVEPSPHLRATALDLVRRHALRAGDAMQLAAAFEWAGETRLGRGFVSLDRRLRGAAEREGFSVLPADA